MKEKLKKYGGLIFLGVAILWIGYALFRRHEIEHDYSFTVGQITELTGPGYHSSGDYSLIYHYEVNHRQYSNNANLDLCKYTRLKQIKEAVINKSFAVAYDTKAPSWSVIILSQSSADRFKYKFPDSVLSTMLLLDCDFNWKHNYDSLK